MRKDMKKVLTERPRRGHGGSYHDIRKRNNRGDYEDMPSKQGIRQPYKDYYDDYCNRSSDLIGPLNRFIRGCIGKKYDDVYSEFCKIVSSGKKGNNVDIRLLDRFRNEITIDEVIIENDELFSKRRYRKLFGLYVDPRDGIIYDGGKLHPKQKNKNIRRTNNGYFKLNNEDNLYYPTWTTFDKANNNVDCMFFTNEYGYLVEANKINGIWYWIHYDIVPEGYIHNMDDLDEEGNVIQKAKFRKIKKTDVISGYTCSSGEQYRSKKTQISNKYLKKHGLINDIY